MYVITGATGNIGSKLTEMLLSQGQKVRAVGRSAERLRPFLDKGAEAAVGDMKDSAFLTKAFSGASAVFAMIPPDYTAEDFRAHYDRIGSSIAKAIQDSGVRHVVSLSSQGADLAGGTGPIKGLHDQEVRLNSLEAVNILHLRPAYFMENTFAFIGMIRKKRIIGSALKGDMKFAMIATRDIAKAAAESLVKRDFSGKQVRNLLGQRDLSMNEVTTIIGKRLGLADLKYVQFSYEETEKGLISAGFSANAVKLFVEMYRALNEGLLSGLQRTTGNTTETPFEEFVETFARVYESRT